MIKTGYGRFLESIPILRSLTRVMFHWSLAHERTGLLTAGAGVPPSCQCFLQHIQNKRSETYVSSHNISNWNPTSSSKDYFSLNSCNSLHFTTAKRKEITFSHLIGHCRNKFFRQKNADHHRN